MKVRFALLGALTLAAAPLMAQGGGAGAQGGMMSRFLEVPSTDTLASQLGLSADQKTKVAALHDKYESSTKDARAEVAKAMASGDRAAMRGNPAIAKIREARTTYTDGVKALLTADQKAKYDELYPERRGRRGGG